MACCFIGEWKYSVHFNYYSLKWNYNQYYGENGENCEINRGQSEAATIKEWWHWIRSIGGNAHHRSQWAILAKKNKVKWWKWSMWFELTLLSSISNGWNAGKTILNCWMHKILDARRDMPGIECHFTKLGVY